MSSPPNGLPPQNWQELLLPAQLQSAARARTFVRTNALAAGFDTHIVAEIEVAVGEATTNAVLYGAPPANSPPEVLDGAIRVIFREEQDSIIIEIQDSGPGFTPENVRRTRPGDSESLGGRGLILMEALMDRVILEQTPNGMRVRMQRLKQ